MAIPLPQLEELRNKYIDLGIKNDRYPNGRVIHDILFEALAIVRSNNPNFTSDEEWKVAALNIYDDILDTHKNKFTRIPR